ncbi:hypothetical protein Tco_1035163, partial [Tanacetum coccineum]
DGIDCVDTVILSDEDALDRLELGSHKENSEKNDDDKKKDDKKDDDVDNDDDDHALIRTRVTGSSEIRTEKMQTPISSPPKSPRLTYPRIRMCMRQGFKMLQMKKKYVTNHHFQGIKEKVNDALKDTVPKLATMVTSDLINDNIPRIVANNFKKEKESSQAVVHALISQEFMKSDLQAQVVDSELWDVLRAKFDKSSASSASCRNDAFRKHDHDEHKGDDAPPEGEKKCEKAKDVEKLKVLIDKDKVISEDETPELIDELILLEEWEYRGKRYVLSLHKIHSISFLEEDLEEKMNRWVKIVFKTFNEEERLSIQHWKDTWHKRMYKINHKKVRDDSEDFFSDCRIVEIIKVTIDQQYGLDYMERIAVMRENDKPDSFSEADFKYLNKKDIKDMYYLYLNTKMNRENKLLNSLLTFIRSCVIWERVHDFQLGIESYQIKINLTALTLTFSDIEACDPFLIVDKPTTEKVLNEVKMKIFETKFLKKALLLGSLDLKIMKAYEREIMNSLKHRKQMRRWDSFVNGRPILQTMKHQE